MPSPSFVPRPFLPCASKSLTNYTISPLPSPPFTPDEVDAIGTKRFDSQTGADREVQRVLMELLTQMDGFDQHTNVKVIMATNRHDTLDPALMRPGRLDRKIEFPPPDRRQKRLIFQACTQKMNLGDDVDLEDFVARPEKISAADIASICSEAGLQAVRNNRYVVLAKDFQSSLLGVAECLAHNKPPFTHESYAHTHTHARAHAEAYRKATKRQDVEHLFYQM